MLIGLTVGAPPDPLGPQGQNWGLVGFSPRGLLQERLLGLPGNDPRSFAPCGRRSDRPRHGADPALGAAGRREAAERARISRFPEQDLLRLVALELWRHRAIVLGEDLGTVPEGFQEPAARRRGDGPACALVRARRGLVHPALGWTREAVAMTSTHDLPTVAGWWSGRDLDWRASSADPRGERRRSARDARGSRRALECVPRQRRAPRAIRRRPMSPARAVDAAIRHVGPRRLRTRAAPGRGCAGQREQPNLPGTLARTSELAPPAARPRRRTCSTSPLPLRGSTSLAEARPRG